MQIQWKATTLVVLAATYEEDTTLRHGHLLGRLRRAAPALSHPFPHDHVDDASRFLLEKKANIITDVTRTFFSKKTISDSVSKFSYTYFCWKFEKFQGKITAL